MNIHPVHRAIVAVDIQASTSRTDTAKAHLRSIMYDALEKALLASGITDTGHDPLIDRGDGAFVLIHPADQTPKTTLLTTFIPTLHDLLTEHHTNNANPLRLRAAVHAGEVNQDERGWFGEALDLTFRLLDAPKLKTTLRNTDEPLALVVSDNIYRTVIRHGYHGIDEHSYTRLIGVRMSGQRHFGWIHRANPSPDNP